MFNRTITIDVLAAWFCWGSGTALAFGDMLSLAPNDSGFVGVVAVAFGHLIVVQQAHRQMDQRERDAFELGREAGPVRRLR